MYCVPVIENETGSRAFQELFYNLNYKTIVSQNLRMLERNLVFFFFLFCYIALLFFTFLILKIMLIP